MRKEVMCWQRKQRDLSGKVRLAEVKFSMLTEELVAASRGRSKSRKGGHSVNPYTSQGGLGACPPQMICGIFLREDNLLNSSRLASIHCKLYCGLKLEVFQ